MSSVICSAETAHMFFDKFKNGRFKYATEAKAMCSVCHVKSRCADMALSRDDEHGIWGGLDETDRRNIRATRKPLRSFGQFRSAVAMMLGDTCEAEMQRMQGVL